jgi:predicted transcriptional regulator/DNA-binding transcriptional MerR regulator
LCLAGQEGDVVFDQHNFLRQVPESSDEENEDFEAGEEDLGSDQNRVRFVGKSVRERILDIRPSSRKDHVQLLRTIYDSSDKELSMNELSRQTGIRPQNIHARLRRLEDIGLLARRKRNGKPNALGRSTKEYIYCIPSDIPLDEIKEFLNNENQLENQAPNPSTEKPIEKVIKTMEAQADASPKEIDSIASKEPVSSKNASLAEILIKKLPEFDPSWNEEMQAKWFASYERLIALGDRE